LSNDFAGANERTAAFEEIIFGRLASHRDSLIAALLVRIEQSFGTQMVCGERRRRLGGRSATRRAMPPVPAASSSCSPEELIASASLGS